MEKDIYNPPESNLEVGSSDGSILASRWSRLWASLIDVLTVIPITIPLYYFTGGFDGISQGVEPSVSYLLVMFLISTAIFLAIHGKIMLRDGQTWGKKAQNIKIVTIDGEHADLAVLAKRYGFYWGVSQIPVVGQLLSMVNILFIFTKSKRCLHDHVGGTKVVQVIK